MSGFKKRLYYFWKKTSERQSRKKLGKTFFKGAIARFEACTTKKPAAQMRAEMKALQQHWNCFPYQYYRFDFYRTDCPASLEEMKQYVPVFFLHYLFFPISYKDYGILCEDKLLTYASLAAFDVPQPNMLFCFDNHQFYDTHNNLIAADDVDALIQASTSKKLFIKPRFGSEGKDIFIFNKNNDNRFADKEQTIFNHNFFLNDTRIRATSGRDATGFYVIQEGLVQHEEVNQIYAGAINTFRVITECIQGEAQLLFALLRMGRGGNQVDNASSGGVYTKIDPVSGALGDVAIAHDRAAFEAHPDTGFQFKGATIKAWQNVKALALEAAIKFREIRHVGWDIALTPDGPVIIEINKRPDMDMIQDFYGGIQHHLKIDSREWWYQSDYTIKNL